MHKISERWSTGGFDKIYHLRCSCGVQQSSRSGKWLLEMQRDHVAAEKAKDA